MRIDGTSLIAAQSAFPTQRASQAVPPTAQPADKPLFQTLDFPKAELEATPSKPATAKPQKGFLRLGAQLDITI
jgi:hypothetical protein